MGHKSVLIISDCHFPYSHESTIPFLAKIKEKYKPDTIIHIGDEIDNHALSFHDSDPDLASAGDELKRAREYIWQLEELFPKMTVLESNHGSLAYRKAKHHGIPQEMLRPYKEILDVKHWTWVREHKIVLPNKQPCMFAHQKSANYLLASQKLGMSFVSGHYHSKFGIQYWGTSERLNFGMNVGCLIDDDAMAFLYNKLTLERPIIGTGMIIDSQPKLIPLVMNGRRKWTGKIN